MPASILAAAAELRAMAASADDASGYFPALYARVTDRIASSMDAGHFADGHRMDVFASTFAGYCTRAWHAERGRPRCWQACRNVAADPDLLIAQHLFLGINAHVNHDLALAVVDVAGPSGDLALIKPDFDAVNDVLGETSSDVLRSLGGVSRWTNRVAAVGGGKLFNFSLRVARAQAWGAAVRINALTTPDERAAYVAELDRLVSVLAYLITRPPLPARPLVWVGRRLEERDPRTVTAALLGGG
jgi:hypothetical protein